jgi:soluble lytic murein transglycosylase-like protein
MKIMRYQPGQVQPAALPGPYQSANTSVAAFGGQTGQAMEQLGQNMQRVAAQADDIRGQIAEARTKEAENAFHQAASEVLTAPETGYFTQRGRAAIDSAETVRKSLYDLARQHEEKLEDPLAKRMFRDVIMPRMTGYAAQVNNHYSREAVDYNNTQSESRVANLVQEGVDNHTQPEIVLRSLASARAEIVDMGQRNGWAPEVVQQRLRTVESNYHAQQVSRWLDRDPVKAQEYLNKNAGYMHGNDWAVTEKAVQDKMLDVNARTAVQQVFAPAATGNLDALTASVMKQESGGRDFNAQGGVLTSSAGAKGRMQVLDETNYNPGFGVQPAKDDSLEERARVGRDYLKAMSDRYASPVLALAAYNAGPGRVDEWIKQFGDPRTGQISEAAFAQKIPLAETKTYVARVLVDAGTQAARLPSETEAIERARALAGGNLQQAEENVKQVKLELATRQRAEKELQDQLEQQAFAAIEAGTSPNSLPYEARVALGREKMAGLHAYAEARIKGGEPKTNWTEYDRLSHMTDDEIRKEDLLKSRHLLSDSDFRHFAARQRGQTPPDVASLKQQLDTAFDQLEWTGPKHAEDRGYLASVINSVIDDQQKRQKKELSWAERQEIIDRALMQRKIPGTIWDRSAPLAKFTVDDIPAEDLRIIRDLAPELNDQAALDAYRRRMVGARETGQPQTAGTAIAAQRQTATAPMQTPTRQPEPPKAEAPEDQETAGSWKDLFRIQVDQPAPAQPQKSRQERSAEADQRNREFWNARAGEVAGAVQFGDDDVAARSGRLNAEAQGRETERKAEREKAASIKTVKELRDALKNGEISNDAYRRRLRELQK